MGAPALYGDIGSKCLWLDGWEGQNTPEESDGWADLQMREIFLFIN